MSLSLWCFSSHLKWWSLICSLGRMNGSVQAWTAWFSCPIRRWWSSAGSCLIVFCWTITDVNHQQSLLDHMTQAHVSISREASALEKKACDVVLIQISYYFKSHHLTCLSSVLPFFGPEKHFLQKHFVSRDILTSGEGLRSASTCGHGADEQPSLSQTGFGRWKLLLFETLVKHYSRTDRPPLLPQHMTYVYTAITDLLGDYCCLQRITPNITHS